MKTPNQDQARVPGMLGLVLISLLSLAACQSQGGEPLSAAADGPSDVSAEHAHARRTYERRCVQCHALYPPSAFTDEEWADVMPDMAREANLPRAEADRVLAWLQAVNDS